MPFPLAHPAAVLPLRRWCPRFLSFPALVIGSLCPDAGYAFGKWNTVLAPHHILGSVGFCLPVGLLCVWVFYGFRERLAGALPEAYRRLFLPLCQRPAAPIHILAVSIIVGAWTHLLLDGWSHRNGWFVEHWAWLRSPLMAIGQRRLRIYHLLWYAFTFGGALWLGLAYLKWLSGASGKAGGQSGTFRVVAASGFALLVLVLAAIHHLAHYPLEIYATSLGMAVAVLGFAILARPRA